MGLHVPVKKTSLYPTIYVAVSVGVLTLEASPQTTDLDGNRYEPISVRVVASVFPSEGRATSGKIIDGWQVELFAVDASAQCWPAAEAVGLYFGRAGQENRFAQEDREIGLDRIFSYELAGQEFASLVGLGVWNLKVVEGFLLDPPEVNAAPPARRQAQVDERMDASWPSDPRLKRLLDELDWETMLKQRPGWSWDGEQGLLVCPEGRTLTLTTVRKAPKGGSRRHLILRRPWAGCQNCATRTDCLKAANPMACKHLEVTVTVEQGDKIANRLAQIRGKQVKATSPICVQVQEQPGELAVREALFLPASARSALKATFEQASLRIEVLLPTPAKPHLKLVADDVGERQRRRKTWTQNLARYAIESNAQVLVNHTCQWLRKSDGCSPSRRSQSQDGQTRQATQTRWGGRL